MMDHIILQPTMGRLDVPHQEAQGFAHNRKVSAVTAPHSGHFMTSNLDDDDDTVDGLGRGLGIEEPDPSTSGIVLDPNPQQKKGYNFEDACKTPRNTYRFRSSNNKHYVKDFDNSLSKLFACMTLAYSGKLSTPKFKAFRGMKINVWDKMRLNNIIWREWHLQFVKMHRPLVCNFTIHMDVHTKPQAVVLEGKYWKRKEDIVKVEYQKWRIFYKKKIMPKARDKAEVIGEDQIQDLLNQVADHGAHDFLQAQTQMEDDDPFDMDFSDTLFSTLEQTTYDNEEYFGNPDFIQPHLVGLQPNLEDKNVTMDSIEPFPGFLNDALGWPTSSQSHTVHQFTAAAEPSPDLFAVPSYIPTTLQPSQSANQQISPAQPTNHLTLPVQLTNSQQVLATSVASRPQVVVGEQLMPPPQMVTGQQVASVPLIQAVPLQQRLAPQRVPTAIRPKPTNKLVAANNRLVVMEPLDTGQQRPLVVPPPLSTHFTTTLLTKGRQPRTIAPKASKPTPPSSVLTQLLMTNLNPSRLNSTTVASSSKSKTIVPGLVAVSGSSSAPDSNPTASTSSFPSTQDRMGDGAPSGNSVSAVEDLQPPGGYEVRKDAQLLTPATASAEHKRRSHIKNGFEAIQSLVPSLANNPNSKVSKATMLAKTAEFAQKLKTERQQMQQEADLLQQEIEALNEAICTCQSQLPATGVPVASQHQGQMKQMLDAYIMERTNQNWKFYIFSQLASPLFDSFSTMVSTAGVDELYRTTQAWLDQHCTLPALRPAILSSLRTIGTDTSMLSDPSKFPEQARAAVNQRKKSTGNFPVSTSSTLNHGDSHSS